MKKPLLALLLAWGLVAGASGQDGEMLASTVPGVEEALTRYDSATAESQHLYNGRMYFINKTEQGEHAFFRTDEWTRGTVQYDGQRFENVPLLYDIYLDQLVARYQAGFGNVALQGPKVSEFTMDGHKFMRVEADTGRIEGLRTGYYDQLYDGPTRVVARRRKERVPQVYERTYINLYPQKDVYYIYQNKEYQPVRTRQTLLTLFQDQKRLVKRHLRRNGLSFRREREQTIVAAATVYDQLTEKQ